MITIEKLKYYDVLSNNELVRLLKDADNDAWSYIYVRVVKAVIGGSTKTSKVTSAQ